MKKYLFCIMFVAICNISSAQNKNRTKVNATKDIDKSFSDDTIKSSVTTIDNGGTSYDEMSLYSKIKNLEQENRLLKAQIKALKSDSAHFAESITKIEDKKNQAVRKYEDYKNKYSQLTSKLNTVDAIIYKQCLLYPLEGRYNELSIRESLETIDAFSEITDTPSKKFSEYRKIYEPLLKKYNTYNQEFLSFIEKEVKPRIINGKISTSHKSLLEGRLKESRYYRECYLNRNKPPYSSIVYLDEAYDKFFTILTKSTDIDKDVTNLLNSLLPKKQADNK